MPSTAMSLAAKLLDHIVTRTGEEDTPALLEQLRQADGDTDEAEMVTRMHNQLSVLSLQQKETGLTERSLNLLIDTTHDLSCTLSLQDLLRKIVSRARQLVSANIAWLTVLDEDAGYFRTIATEGNLQPETAVMTAPVDRGAVSVVMATKSFFTTQNYSTDQRFAHSPELDNKFDAEKIVSLAGFPILSDGKVMGLLFIADRYSRSFSGREISVLGSFALHAGVALRNARAFAQLSEALEAAESNRRSLEDHIQRVEDSAQAHDVMMSLLAQGADLLSFMQRMAAQISGAILYMDSALIIREEVATDTYDGSMMQQLRHGAFDRAALLSAIARSRENGRSAVLLDTGDERCLVVSLHNGAARGDCLIICHQDPIDQIQLRNLERSTVALSIAKLWTEKRETEQLLASSTLLRHLVLVSQPDTTTITSVRDRLSLAAQQPVRIALILLSGQSHAAQTELIRNATSKLNVLADLLDDAYLAIGPVKDIDTMIDTLRRRSNQDQLGGILSKPFKNLSETSSHHARIDKALHTMQKIMPVNQVLEETQVSLFARLFEGGDPGRLTDFVAEALTPINARDPRQRAQLKKTLLCFFDCQFNIARTADQMGIHVNTMRQRLETLRDVTGGWDNPIIALELHVALRLDALSDAP